MTIEDDHSFDYRNCQYWYFLELFCSLDVYVVTEGDVLLVSVSELGGRLALRLSERIPSTIGELKLYKTRTDNQVRLLIGSSFLIDYEDHVVVPGDDYETLLESSIYHIHSLISEGDYLVVAWQDPWDIADDSCFMVGLYKGEARRKLEDLLR